MNKTGYAILIVIFSFLVNPLIAQNQDYELIVAAEKGDSALVDSLMKIIDTFFEKFKQKDAGSRKTIEEEINSMQEVIRNTSPYILTGTRIMI